MLYRYSTQKDGSHVRAACVYTKEEHKIQKSLIDADALGVIDRLKRHGHSAYIVGGAVRDLLIGKKPKDFDIVTDAQPNKIKKLFWNARIIGRRFRLVHVFFDQKIFEVSTFRSTREGTVGNEYGTIEEDVHRRDFTMNALYYDPKDELVIDYVGGFKDIQAKKVKPLIPLNIIFTEDPVRMLRAAKYSASTGFSIGFMTKNAIKKHARLLLSVSASRMTEEIIKILQSGRSELIFTKIAELGLLPFVLPELSYVVNKKDDVRKRFYASLREIDALTTNHQSVRLGKKLELFIKEPLSTLSIEGAELGEILHLSYHEARKFLRPMNPPRIELEFAVRQNMKARGVILPVRERVKEHRSPESLPKEEVLSHRRSKRRHLDA